MNLKFSAIRKSAARWLIFPLVAVVILLMPIILPIVAIMMYFDRRRIRAIVRQSICPKCGQPLNDECIDAADRRWSDIMAERRRRHPGIKLGVVRDVDVICLACGAMLRFTDGDKTLVVVEPYERSDDDPV